MNKKAIYQKYRAELPTLEVWKTTMGYWGTSKSSQYRHNKKYLQYRSKKLDEKINSLGGWKELYPTQLARIFDDVYGDCIKNLIPSSVSMLRLIPKEDNPYHYPIKFPLDTN
jgi:hypothetical protein